MIDYKKLHNFLTKPVQKNGGLFVTVKRFYTDVNGTVIDKNDPMVPALAKTYFPFWMFGQYDAWGGYRIGNQIFKPDLNAPYVGTFIVGKDVPFLFATGLNDIKDRLLIGDVVHIYTDNISAPTVYIWVVQSCGAVSLASVYSNASASEHEKIRIKAINFFAFTNNSPNFQFARPIHLTKIDVVGSYVDDSFDALSYDQTFNKQHGFVTVPISLEVDQYHMLTSAIAFEIDVLNFSFIIKKNTVPTYGLDQKKMDETSGDFSQKSEGKTPMTNLYNKYQDATV